MAKDHTNTVILINLTPRQGVRGVHSISIGKEKRGGKIKRDQTNRADKKKYFTKNPNYRLFDFDDDGDASLPNGTKFKLEPNIC